MSDDTPKSALELTLERLRRQDREAGVAERPLSDEQRARIAEIRSFYEAKLAESEILQRSSLVRAADAEAAERIEEQHRSERERLRSERDRKIEDARNGR